ncbi:MAG TPA: aldo/keto reductase [Rhizomicrobium sp.]|jgi:spore coat polysaccharide biosynthesis protein SpsF
MGGLRPAELVLGTVQLGIPYGIANGTGKPSRALAVALIRRAVETGITSFDTARAYGDSEECLGEALAHDSEIRIITKLSPLNELPADAPLALARQRVDASLEASWRALRRERIDCVLLHRARHLEEYGGAVWERLLEHRSNGRIGQLGVSVQSPAETRAALLYPDIRHIQLPFHLLDWRWQEAGIPDLFRARSDVTVHARSVFLQGLLAANAAGLWPRLPGVDPAQLSGAVAALSSDLARASPADLALAYARGQDWLDGIVIGMETRAQLDDNLKLFANPPLALAACAKIVSRVPRVPVALLDPSRWHEKACA